MPTPSNFTKYPSVNYAMSVIMSELGIPAPGTFLGSSDLNVQQLLTYLGSVGQDLCMMYDWQFLHKVNTITLVPGQSFYPLPADFNGFIDSTFWDNTTRLPVIGPVTPQVWRMLKARLISGSTISLQYQIVNNQVEFYNPPVAADTLQVNYYSRGWIQDQTTPTVYRDNPQNDSDLMLFDSRVLVTGTKLRWREGKGFDTQSYVEDFNNAFDAVVGRDTPGTTLSLGQRSGYPFFGYQNIPDSNYGT